MMWRTYRELLSQIQQDPMCVVTRRVTVPITRQANLAIHHFIPRLFAKLPRSSIGELSFRRHHDIMSFAHHDQSLEVDQKMPRKS